MTFLDGTYGINIYRMTDKLHKNKEQVYKFEKNIWYFEQESDATSS